MKRKKKGVKKVKPVKRISKPGECFICGATSNLQDHHIIPKCIGGENLKDNKAHLCDTCHKKVHQLVDPVIAYMGQAIMLLQDELKAERTGGLQAPIGFRGSKNRNGGKRR